MCGFAGLWTAEGEAPEALARVVGSMRDTLSHRGPDDAGVWVDAEVGLALGHRRLSVLELSAEGHQPMRSASGRFTLVYNGEVYNSPALRDQLDGPWRGRSDTEVLLAAFERWGVLPAVERFVGMFAFAAWDAVERRLWLVRDRLGIKPLYWGRAGRAVVFGSELHALAAHPDLPRRVHRGALAASLRYNCVPAPYSIYEGVYKLAPGTALELGGPEGAPRVHTWWSAADVVTQGRAEPFRGTPEQAVDALHELLDEAVGGRMVADVPLGAFLSGGIDSSTVVALMQARSERPVRTFSIGYRDQAYDEATHAREVARHLGTDHTELIVEPDDALAVIPRLSTLYDEPFSDSSQIPTFLVSELARRKVTVALSGDGGDELFAGYNRHLWAPCLWRRMRRIPRSVRRLAGRGLTAVSPSAWDQAFQRASRWLPPDARVRTPGDKAHKLGRVLGAGSAPELYQALCSQWQDPLDIVLADEEAHAGQAAIPDLGLPFAEQMMLLDLRTYLPDDILTKVDRASMAVGLEARVPLLDHRIVGFAWSLPQELKIRGGVTKWVLRQVLYRHVPRALVERPKTGFGIPIGGWLRGPLRPWAEALLDPDRMREEGFLRPEPIQALWRAHQQGRLNAEHLLWSVLMFQSWLERARPDTS